MKYFEIFRSDCYFERFREAFSENVAKLRPTRWKMDRPDDRFLDEFFNLPVGLQHQNAQLDDLNHLTDHINLNRNRPGFIM